MVTTDRSDEPADSDWDSFSSEASDNAAANKTEVEPQQRAQHVPNEAVVQLKKELGDLQNAYSKLEKELNDVKTSNTSLIRIADHQAIMMKELREADRKEMVQMQEKLMIANLKLEKIKEDELKIQPHSLLKDIETTLSKFLEANNLSTGQKMNQLLQQAQNDLNIKDSQCMELEKELEFMRKSYQTLLNDQLKTNQASDEEKAALATEKFNKDLEIEELKKEKFSIEAKKNEVERKIEEQKEENKILKQQNNKLQMVLDEAKSSVSLLPSSIAEVEDKPKKYLILDDYESDKDMFDIQNTEIINDWNLDNLHKISTNVSSYHKEMFVIAHCWFFNCLHRQYNNILSYCQQWKKLRPEGEIRVMRWVAKGKIDFEPSTQLTALLTSCKDLNISTTAWRNEIVSFIASEWSKYSDQLLSDEDKRKYLP